MMKTVVELHDDKRIEYIDIAKGILITLVVLGHSEFKYRDIIYWFHMPAFFIISGLLYKKRSLNLLKLAKKIFIPYLSFSIINIPVLYLTDTRFNGLQGIFNLIGKHIYSGKDLDGVFWFIPVFFLTKTIFDFLYKHTKTRYFGIIIVSFYVIAHMISIYLFPAANHTNVPQYLVLPWDIDVVLITIWYYFIGVKLKNYINKINTEKMLYYSGMFCALFIVINKLYGINYCLDIKYSYYKFLVLDTVIPVLFTLFILSLSSKIPFKDVRLILAYLGRKSLYIMYLHIAFNSLLMIEVNYEYTVYTLLGVLLPLAFSKLVESSRYSKLLFNGD